MWRGNRARTIKQKEETGETGMTSKLVKFLVAAALMASLSMTAQALPSITGAISLSGSVLSDNADLTAATTFSFSGVTVGAASGTTYSGIPTGPVLSPSVTMNPITFRPSPIYPVTPLWDFTYLGQDYRFALGVFAVTSSDVNDITLKGLGVLRVPGLFADTDASWILTAQTLGGVTSFTFSSSNAALAVPDGGTTVLLLGAALTGLALIKRRLS
jgi:hypothetical protein